MRNGAQIRSALGSLGSSLPCFRTGSDIVLELREIAHQHIIELAQPRAGAALDAILSAFQAEALPRFGASEIARGAALLGIGPARWMLIVSDAALELAREKFAAAFDVTVEASDAWTRFAIDGSAALDFLAKGCALDLHHSMFRDGDCAVTRFAQIRCVLHRAGGGYRLFVGRSYAVSLAEWLIEAAAEFEHRLDFKVPAEAPSREPHPYNRST